MSEHSKILKKRWNGFRVRVLEDAETDWFSMFLKLSADAEKQSAYEWKELTLSGIHEHEERHIWKVTFPDQAVKEIIFKQEINKRRRTLDRWFRGLFISAFNLQRNIEKARAQGFLFPMRIFLVAEKRRLGFLQERFFVTEFVDGTSLRTFKTREEEILRIVRQTHRYDICWGGDPNETNFMVQKDGTLRGIDFCFKNATWRERGKDLRLLSRSGIPLAGTALSVAVANLQVRVKAFFSPKRKN